jgi:hypothetical protein
MTHKLHAFALVCDHEGGPQRPLPLRVRPEIQKVLRRKLTPVFSFSLTRVPIINSGIFVVADPDKIHTSGASPPPPTSPDHRASICEAIVKM